MLPKDKLRAFALIRSPKLLEDTHYFEFFPGVEEPETCGNERALFLSSAGFDFFHFVFARSNPAYGYYAFSYFDAHALSCLDAEINRFAGGIGRAHSIAEIFACFPDNFAACSSDYWSDCRFSDLRKAILGAAEGIQEFADRARIEHGGLWVLGM